MITLAAVLTALALPAHAAAPGTAEAAAARIYRDLPRANFGFRKVRYAPRLALEAADAGDGVGLLDAVPFCDCQDTASDYRFAVSSRAAGRGRAVVTVHLRNGGAAVYRIDMVRLVAGWAVADVHGPVHASLAAWMASALGGDGGH